MQRVDDLEEGVSVIQLVYDLIKVYSDKDDRTILERYQISGQ